MKNKKKIAEYDVGIIFSIIGPCMIIYGGDLVVDKASSIANTLGMSEALVGLTIVAVGTSLPELVTSVVASIKKENDIAIGNVIGSNVFNVIFILGMSSALSPLTVSTIAIFDIVVMLVTGIIVLLISLLTEKTNKMIGIFMVLLYISYATYIVIRN